MSTGTIFSKALADAMVKRNVADEMKKIERFINEETAFQVTSITLEKGIKLVVNAIRAVTRDA